MKIGIVNPYSWDVPGGVQFHIRDFALELLKRGHDVKVLTPAKNTTDLPEWITAVGSSVAIPFNGSVARLSFSPIANARTKKWLEEGDFDVLHVHEPEVPSISMSLGHSTRRWTILSRAQFLLLLLIRFLRSLPRELLFLPRRVAPL